MNGALKPKGERAWVLKVWDITNNRQEILAIRFSTIQTSQQFALQYNTLFPPQHQVPTFAPLIAQRQSTGPWVCAVCTYSNDENKLNCLMCGLSVDGSASLKAQNAANQTEEEKPWACISCTFVNTATALACGVCDAKKTLIPPSVKAPKQPPQVRPLSSPQNVPQNTMNTNNNMPNGELEPNVINNSNKSDAPWICAMCTLENAADLTQCDACSTSRSAGSKHIGSHSNRNSIIINPMMMNSIINPMNAPNMSPPLIPPMNAMNPMINPLMNNPINTAMAAQNINNMMNTMVYGKSGPTRQELERAAADIGTYNEDPSEVFATLRSVTKKLLKRDIRYRTLDTTNPKVMERLIGFAGVLDFLLLMGFESDAMGMKLVCEQIPAKSLVKTAVDVLNSYETRLGIGKLANKKTKVTKKSETPIIAQSQQQQTKDGTQGGQQQNMKNENEDLLTLEQIILWSTHESMRDNETMRTLIITHKTITDSSVTLLKQLRRRFFVPVPRDIAHDKDKVVDFRNKIQKSIQLKVIKALRDWMKLYWDEDFSLKYSQNGKEMQKELSLWIGELEKTSQSDSESKWIAPLTATVEKEFNRYKTNNEKEDEKEFNPQLKRIKLNIDQDIEPFDLLRKVIPNIMTQNDDIVIAKNYSSILSNFDCEHIADQITLIDYQIFSSIEARECIGQSWKKKKNKIEAPHILAMIQQFNNLTIYVQIQILRQRSLKERSKVIRKIIGMGERFKNLRNYNSLCAIYSALHSAPIHRLKAAWNRVPQKYQQMFENFKGIFSRDLNTKNLRNLFKNSPAPSIPHIGLFLQDLVFIDDGNSNKIEIDNFKQHGSMVNFNKCVRICERIKGIRLYQTHPYLYHHENQNTFQPNLKNTNLKNDVATQKMLLMEYEKLKDVTEDQIWDMSSEIKKMDNKAAKKAMF